MPVYLLHFETKIGNFDKKYGSAQHYLGSTNQPLEKRFAEHQSGTGAKITAHASRLGIGLICVRVWDGSFELERQLKRRHNHPQLCPKCNPNFHKYARKWQSLEKQIKEIKLD